MKDYKTMINQIVARLEDCGVKFTRGTEVIERDRLMLDYNQKKANADMAQLVSNALACEGLKFSYLALDEADTWLSSTPVWHIVVRTESKKMFFQWTEIVENK